MASTGSFVTVKFMLVDVPVPADYITTDDKTTHDLLLAYFRDTVNKTSEFPSVCLHFLIITFHVYIELTPNEGCST